VITYLSPGLGFFHQGQFEGRTKRISPHLVRAPEEPVNQHLRSFYERLLSMLRLPVVRAGRWQLLDCSPAWDGNWTAENFIAWSWETPGEPRLVVAVNYSGDYSQCYVRLPFERLCGQAWCLQDRLSAASYERDGAELEARGLYLDVPPWHCHIFEMTCRR
jgi:hypothetical protein